MLFTDRSSVWATVNSFFLGGGGGGGGERERERERIIISCDSLKNESNNLFTFSNEDFLVLAYN